MHRFLLALAILVDLFLVIVVPYYVVFPYKPDVPWFGRALGVVIVASVTVRLVRNIREAKKCLSS